ncbi:MAG: hypothetical protein ACYCX2_02860 [Christensenellales bacterium]
MGFVKCPRCELNYIKEDEKYCNVCKREMKGEDLPEEIPDICVECNENPAVPGESLCLYCLREKRQLESMDKLDDLERPASEVLELDDVSGLSEIDIEDDEAIPPTELEVIDQELSMEEPIGLLDVDEEEDDEEDDYDYS